ncbi:Exoenzyme S synthesis regulatory protein ExsA [Jannaschia donghaensis]|uniref:Exoenzyme S synthesis regulatory protein ExsA n=2 Tax=Jannaschia donghaensis TaxID=420998 RepID=A0A0M6YF51_9RHOB|nr:Exoenzyme S synthesis regulatory protein ExsA [Jannaschia donghaensis]
MIVRDGAAGTDPWTTAALRLIALEADRMGDGAGAILTRAVEIVFVQAIRAAIADLRDMSNVSSFLAALADRHLTRALTAIHATPAAPWTLTQLAREAGLSRTAFAERFAKTVGQPPMAYLAGWRVTLAGHLLRDGNLSTDEIAERVGYASPAAFARRFKAATGIGPGAYRRAN